MKGEALLTFTRFALVTTVWLPLATASGAAQQLADSGIIDHWTGSIEGDGYQMGIDLELRHSGHGWSGDAIVPEWGTYRWPIAGIVVDHDRVSFHLEEVRGVAPAFSGDIKGDEFRGKYSWRGQEFSYLLTRQPTNVPRQHSLILQLPTRPFPYDEQRVTFKNGQVTLGGLITVPRDKRPHPAVVFLSGSIATEADPMIPGPPGREQYASLVLADTLSRAGVATLRMDSRGLGASNGNFDDSTISERADDALAAVVYVGGRTEIDRGRIGLVGFSQGGTVAFVAASRGPSISFLVSLCGPVVPGDECYLAQYRKREGLLISDVFGDALRQAASDQIQLDVSQMRHIYDLVKTDVSNEEVRRQFFAWHDAERKRLDGSKRDEERHRKGWFTRSRPPTTSLWDEANAEKYIATACIPSERSYIRLDPRAYVKQLRIPVMAVYGGLDSRVDASDNLREMKKALGVSQSPTPNVFTVERLGHDLITLDSNDRKALLDLVTTDQENNVFDPSLLSATVGWIREIAKSGTQSKHP